MTRATTAALLAAAALLSLAACDKDEALPADDAYAFLQDASADEATEALLLAPAELEAAYDETPARRRQRFSGECLSLVYPVSVDLPGGATVEVADSAALKATLREWAATRTERRGARPRLVYPVTVTTADGDLVEIATRAEMRATLRACAGAPEPCVSLVYPVQVTLGDRTATAETAAELRELARAYRAADAGGPRPQLVYPLTVEYADGTTAEVADRRGWREIRGACRGARPDCLSFVFPVTVANRAGATHEVNSLPALRVALSHAGPRGRQRLQFPVTVTTADGTEVTVEDRAGLRALRRACR